MRIILDVMGGDKPVEEFVKGAVSAIKEYGCEVTLVGNKAQIYEAISQNRLSMNHLYIVDAPEYITMDDSPMSVVKEKNKSSMHEGLKLLAEGKGDAFVSAGNTGALLAGATFIVRRIKGLRAAIGTILPLAKPVMLVDSGANLQVTPENLEQFAKMGSIYMEKLHGIKNPTVGLLNNGTEATKGHELQRETFLRLSVSDDVNFVGNIEGRDIPFARTDVVVTDGFTGNVVLKLTEGFGKFMIEQLKELFNSNLLGKPSYLMLKKSLKAFKKKFDAAEYGGAPLLGISKPVIKAHGSSDEKAVKNAIKQAIYYVNTGIILEIARQTSQTALKTKQSEKTGEEK